MIKVWTDDAWEDYLYWQTQDKKTLKKINSLIKDIDRNGYNCTGKPEPLSGNLAGAFFVGLVGWIWFALAGGPEGTWAYGLHLTIGLCAAIFGCLGGGIYCSVKARRK